MRKRKIYREIVQDPKAANLLPFVVDSFKTPSLAPGELLRMIRTTLRMTQKQLAERSGIDQAHINRMEAGNVDGQWKTWAKLFEAFRCRLVLRVQPVGSLREIIEDRIRKTAEQKVAWGEKMFPDSPLSEADRQEEMAEWVETLQNRHTSDIWEEEEIEPHPPETRMLH